MFNKLKGAMESGSVQKAVDTVSPVVMKYLDEVLGLTPESINDDAQFSKFIIHPAYLGVTSSAGGLTKLIPSFEQRFTDAFIHVRDELVVTDDGMVSLVDDYEDKLPKVLTDSLKAKH